MVSSEKQVSMIPYFPQIPEVIVILHNILFLINHKFPYRILPTAEVHEFLWIVQCIQLSLLRWKLQCGTFMINTLAILIMSQCIQFY